MTNIIKRCKPLLGTYIEISISADVSDDLLTKLSNMALKEIEKIHKLMSFHDQESELSKINAGAFKQPILLSKPTETVIQQALEISQATNGLYDITTASELIKHGSLPDFGNSETDGSWQDIKIHNHHISFERNIKIDLGGIAKGYAVDCAMEILECQNVDYKQVTINAGGDLRVLNWKGECANLRHPSPNKRRDFIEIPMKAPALATSAPNYTNKHSLIINPKSKERLKTNNSISVFTNKCILADALTKVFLLLPDPDQLLDLFGATVISVGANGNIRQL